MNVKTKAQEGKVGESRLNQAILASESTFSPLCLSEPPAIISSLKAFQSVLTSYHKAVNSARLAFSLESSLGYLLSFLKVNSGDKPLLYSLVFDSLFLFSTRLLGLVFHPRPLYSAQYKESAQ